VFARFLVTNEGPGVRTAAAVGHVILAGGEVVPFKWGRDEEDWRLGPDRRRLKIAKAVLELGGPAIVVSVDSEKRGVKLALEIARAGPVVATAPLAGAYWVDVLLPAPVQGRIWVRGMAAPRAVAGTAAVAHTWMERREADVIRRRTDLVARLGGTALFVSQLTPVEGGRRTTMVAGRGGHVLVRADDAQLDSGAATTRGDARYPVPAGFEVRSAALTAQVAVGRELLRWDPLEVLPQPFRFLLALRGRPQRVWADADVVLTMTLPDAGAVADAHGAGIVALSFAQPIAPP
jgi:hypothetical protein